MFLADRNVTQSAAAANADKTQVPHCLSLIGLPRRLDKCLNPIITP